MGRMLIAAVLTLAALPARAAEDDIVLRGMGSFHVGGRVAEVSGRPAREIVRIPGGPPSKLDPNGEFMVEQMYVQYFLPKHRKGKLPLLMWQRRRSHRRDLRNHAGPPRRLAQPVRPQGLGCLRLRRGRARPRGLCEARRGAVRAEFF